MKKVISILLLSLLLFNTWGWDLINIYFTESCQVQVAIPALTKDFKEEHLRLFKIYTPSQNNISTTQEVDGDFVFEDKTYAMVKWVTTKDTLYVYCKNKLDENTVGSICGQHAQVAHDAHTENIPVKEVKLSTQVKDYFLYTHEYKSNLSLIAIVKGNTYYSSLHTIYPSKIKTPPPEVYSQGFPFTA